jgi:lipopolysaccharide transport system ATP-binding protein
MSDVIVVQGLAKQFRRYHADRPRTLKEVLTHGFHKLRPVERFWALHEVSFRVASGQMLGVIGSNGAGKSTLLRLIGGVGRPTRGSIQVKGRIGALLDLGVGFHPELSGRENVFISGVVAGLTRREVAQYFESIVDFAELQPFIESPLRTYSTGMQMRLAFAIAVHTSPDVLLIDEVLAVGDVSFQHKCRERIAQFKAAGCAIILISHETTLIKALCDQALWLRGGRMVAHGTPEMVADQYLDDQGVETRRRTPAQGPTLRTRLGAELRVNENRFGSLEMSITDVRFFDRKGRAITGLHHGEALQIDIEYVAPQPIRAPIFGVTISREDGLICCDTSTASAALLLPTAQGQGRISLIIERLDLEGGQYYADVGIYEADWSYAYDYHWHVYPLCIQAPTGHQGILHPPYRWAIDDVPTPGNGRPERGQKESLDNWRYPS